LLDQIYHFFGDIPVILALIADKTGLFNVYIAAMNYPKAYFYKRIVQAKMYIDEHFAEPIDVHHIANEAFFSKFHFIRQFKKVYGRTPHQYLTHVRIQQAKTLLESNHSVSETCYLVGYDSLSSFSNLFKRLVKITPSTYLAMQQKRQALTQQAPLQFVPGCFAQRYGWKK